VQMCLQCKRSVLWNAVTEKWVSGKEERDNQKNRGLDCRSEKE
jgi:hypothetical protein